MRSLLDALYSERRALFGCFVILCGATLIAAGLMHLAESAAQPEKFGTIPDAMWWAIVTLGTVGYGDAVPITAVGRLIGGLTIFAGLLMVALPVGIVATAFANEVHRRDFVVTWGLVARIPLFSQLSATSDRRRDENPAGPEGRKGSHHCAAGRARAFDVSDRGRRGRDQVAPQARETRHPATSLAKLLLCVRAGVRRPYRRSSRRVCWRSMLRICTA